jgi:hypothetical protein
MALCGLLNRHLFVHGPRPFTSCIWFHFYSCISSISGYHYICGLRRSVWRSPDLGHRPPCPRIAPSRVNRPLHQVQTRAPRRLFSISSPSLSASFLSRRGPACLRPWLAPLFPFRFSPTGPVAPRQRVQSNDKKARPDRGLWWCTSRAR